MPAVKPLTEAGRKALAKTRALEAFSRAVQAAGILAGYKHASDLAERLQMPASTLCLRLREPGTMRMTELFDILSLPGIDSVPILNLLREV